MGIGAGGLASTVPLPSQGIDFTVLPYGGMSAAIFLSKTGLTIANNTSDGSLLTVDTATQTNVLVSGIGPNTARNGTSTDDARRGTLLEGARTNKWTANRPTYSGNTLTDAQWTAGTATMTAGVAGPDGTNNAKRAVCSSGQWSDYNQNLGTLTTLGHAVTQMMLKANANTLARFDIFNLNSNFYVTLRDAGMPAGWVKRQVQNFNFNGASTTKGRPVDGQQILAANYADPLTNITAGSSYSAEAVDCSWDLPQLEDGVGNGSSLIQTPAGTTGTRAADLLSDQRGTALWINSSNAINLEMKFVPTGDLARYQYDASPNDITLWYIDANNRCILQRVTNQLQVFIGGVAKLLGPIDYGDWVAGNPIDLYIQAGGGQLTRAAYQSNGGQVVDLGTAESLGNLTPSGTPFRIFNDGSTCNAFAYLQYLKAW
jgi:hypothetical protein